MAMLNNQRVYNDDSSRPCQLQNPVNNIADADNVWSFDTLRPDGVAREVSSDISSDDVGWEGFPGHSCHLLFGLRTLHGHKDSFSIPTSCLSKELSTSQHRAISW